MVVECDIKYKKGELLMYVVLVYDIAMDEPEGAKILGRIFKICKKYLIHIQNSVFEGEISETQLLKLSKELKDM